MPEENKVVELLENIKEKQDNNAELSKLTSEEVKGLSDKIIESETSSKDALEKVSTDIDAFKSQFNTQLEEVKETGTHLEKAIARMGNGGGGGELCEIEQKAEHEFSNLLRYSKPLSEETNEHIVRGMVTEMFKGMSPERREIEIKELVAGINPQGGYWIRPERLSQVVSRIFETSPIRQFANIVTTTTDVVQMIIDDNEFDSGGWVGETTDRTNLLTDTGDIGLLSIPVQEQFAQPQATQKMIDDAGFDIESYIIGKITDILTRTENGAFVNGDGSQKPRGFLTYDNWPVFTNGAQQTEYTRGSCEFRSSGAIGTFNSDDLKGVQNSLKEAYQPRAIWGMKRATFESIITLKDGTGQYIFESRFINERDNPMLLGKPVVFMDDMPDISTTTSNSPIVYGDFGVGYTIVDRLGIRVIRDEVTKKGTVLFYANKRVGGAVTNFEAVKILWVGLVADLPIPGTGTQPEPFDPRDITQNENTGVISSEKASHKKSTTKK